jgi:hypothetical protein
LKQFILVLPSSGRPVSPRVTCQGQVVRHQIEPPGGGFVAAATIDAYEFLGFSPTPVPGRELRDKINSSVGGDRRTGSDPERHDQ